jgi:hypothetical protein
MLMNSSLLHYIFFSTRSKSKEFEARLIRVIFRDPRIADFLLQQKNPAAQWDFFLERFRQLEKCLGSDSELTTGIQALGRDFLATGLTFSHFEWIALSLLKAYEQTFGSEWNMILREECQKALQLMRPPLPAAFAIRYPWAPQIAQELLSEALVKEFCSAEILAVATDRVNLMIQEIIQEELQKFLFEAV